MQNKKLETNNDLLGINFNMAFTPPRLFGTRIKTLKYIIKKWEQVCKPVQQQRLTNL